MSEYVLTVVAIVGGAAAGAIAVLLGGRRLSSDSERPPRPTLLGWAVLVSGLSSLVFVYLDWTFWGLTVGIAALTAGVGALAKGDRHWPSWVGLVAAAPFTLIVLLASLLFLVGLWND